MVHESTIKSLHHINSELTHVHQELDSARSVHDIQQAGHALHKITAGVEFKKVVHELGDAGHHLNTTLEKAESSIHKAHRVSDSKQCMILVEAGQHAIREALHNLEGHNHGHSSKGPHHSSH